VRTTRFTLPIFRLAAAATGAIMLTLGLPAVSPAFAAVSYTATNVTSTVTGTSVRVTARIASSSTVTAASAGLCARDSKGRDVDFPASSNVSITPAGRGFSATAVFAAGTYSYWPCVNVGGQWTDIGARKSFTVGTATPAPSPSPTPTPTPTPPATSNPSGVAMPVGNLPGWTQSFTEDFSKNVARGSFPGPYASTWLSYNGFTDTSKQGDYDQSIISAQNSTLDLYLHTVNGRPKGAAPVPLVGGAWGGQTYGRFSVRMKSDPVAGYGTGFLLWSDAENWNEGEIDFPEGELNGIAHGYNHCIGNPSSNCLAFDTAARYSDWHTYTIEWTPAKLTYLVDGSVVGSTTSNIPSKPMHWVMQVGTSGSTPPTAATAGHLLIDWATIYRYTP